MFFRRFLANNVGGFMLRALVSFSVRQSLHLASGVARRQSPCRRLQCAFSTDGNRSLPPRSPLGKIMSQGVTFWSLLPTIFDRFSDKSRARLAPVCFAGFFIGNLAAGSRVISRRISSSTFTSSKA